MSKTSLSDGELFDKGLMYIVALVTLPAWLPLLIVYGCIGGFGKFVNFVLTKVDSESN